MTPMSESKDSQELLDETPIHEKQSPAVVDTAQTEVTWQSLPHKKQLLLIALCRLSSPLSNACLLPYLYFLVRSILSDPEHESAPQQISRLTGLLIAAYPLGQVSTSMLWGRLSDTYGRKPAILFGLAVSVVVNLFFGFSRTIGMLLFWRVLAGMANGVLGVMRTMTAEIAKDRRYQTKAFLSTPLIFNSGRVAALAIGGCLADPVNHLPWAFGPSGLFNLSRNPDGVAWTLRYPYALPALFNGVMLGICLLCATLWLNESLPTRENERGLGVTIGKTVFGFISKNILRKHRSKYTALQTEETEGLMADAPSIESCTRTSTPPPFERKSSPPRFRDIWTRNLLKMIFAFGLLPLHNSTFLHIFPVFLSMPAVTNIKPSLFEFSGGLGLASPTVGLYLATFGICGILLQFFVYPRIQKRIGTLGAFRFSNTIFPIAYLFAPYLSLLSGTMMTKWPAMAAILFAQVMARTMAIPSIVMLLTEAAPRRSVLGTVHGAGNTVSALASAVGPILGGILLAYGIDKGSVGFVWWVWMCAVSLVSLAWSLVLDKPEDDDEEKAMRGNE